MLHKFSLQHLPVNVDVGTALHINKCAILDLTQPYFGSLFDFVTYAKQDNCVLHLFSVVVRVEWQISSFPRGSIISKNANEEMKTIFNLLKF